jgi:hypothetical protein
VRLFIKASVNFEKLSEATGIRTPSLIRPFGPAIASWRLFLCSHPIVPTAVRLSPVPEQSGALLFCESTCRAPDPREAQRCHVSAWSGDRTTSTP